MKLNWTFDAKNKLCKASDNGLSVVVRFEDSTKRAVADIIKGHKNIDRKFLKSNSLMDYLVMELDFELDKHNSYRFLLNDTQSGTKMIYANQWSEISDTVKDLFKQLSTTKINKLRGLLYRNEKLQAKISNVNKKLDNFDGAKSSTGFSVEQDTDSASDFSSEESASSDSSDESSASSSSNDYSFAYADSNSSEDSSKSSASAKSSKASKKSKKHGWHGPITRFIH